MQNDLQFLKTRANFIRFSYIEEMEKHLLAFESRLSSKNIKVRWISDEKEFVEFIYSSLTKSTYNKVCFDIPKVSEQFFEKKNFIKQISIDSLEKNNEIAEYLIVQASFGIVETGSIVFYNKLSKNCFNNVEKLFIVLNINDLVVKQNDLDTLLYLQRNIDNNSFFDDLKILNSPPYRIVPNQFQTNEDKNYSKKIIDVYVLLYDNGITELLEDNLLRETLYCINCGKCKEVCPVFKQTNEFSPIDLIKFHCKEENLKKFNLFENTTLCGNCNETCPVQINFTHLIINLMQYYVKKSSIHEKNTDLFKIFLKRSKMNKINSRFRRYFFVRKYFGKNKKLTEYFSGCKEEFFNISLKEKQ